MQQPAGFEPLEQRLRRVKECFSDWGDTVSVGLCSDHAHANVRFHVQGITHIKELLKSAPAMPAFRLELAGEPVFVSGESAYLQPGTPAKAIESVRPVWFEYREHQAGKPPSWLICWYTKKQGLRVAMRGLLSPENSPLKSEYRMNFDKLTGRPLLLFGVTQKPAGAKSWPSEPFVPASDLKTAHCWWAQ